jgi:hypothetical protein
MTKANATSETAKILLYYGQTDKDTLQPKVWLRQCEQVAVVQGWNDNQKIMTTLFALRSSTEKWYQIEIDRLLVKWFSFK